MTALTVEISLWTLTLVAFAGLLIYRSRLALHETHALSLHDETSVFEQEGAEFATREARLRPMIQTATGAFALFSLLVLGTYVAQLLPSVRL